MQSDRPGQIPFPVTDQRKDLIRDFWSAVLPKVAKEIPRWVGRSPSRENWLHAPSDLQGVQYDLWVRAKDAGCGLSLRGKRASPDWHKAVYDGLYAKRSEMEAAFGGPLDWARLDDRKTSYVGAIAATTGHRSSRVEWPGIAPKLIEVSRRFESAIQPRVQSVVASLEQKSSQPSKAAFLLTWNPARWPWTDLDQECERLARGEPVVVRWSTGNTRSIGRGDEVFLLKQGGEPRGIVGHGRAVSEVFDQPHWDSERREQGEQAHYVMVQFAELVNPSAHPPMQVQNAMSQPLAKVNWSPAASGFSLPLDAADELRRLWFRHVKVHEANGFFVTADEAVERGFSEGAIRRITVNAYERNPVARQKCIEHWGARCACCGTDMGERYGPVARGYIHVHHLRPLSGIGQTYRVDPVADLRPVCPNCHAIIHLTDPPTTVEALRHSLARD